MAQSQCLFWLNSMCSPRGTNSDCSIAWEGNSMYVIYWTVYLGKKFPRNYIGSTTLERHKSGYLGSVKSSKYREIWNAEIRENPHLFRSYIIEYVEGDKASLLERESWWHDRYHVAVNPLFVNMSHAKKKFFSTSESAIKAAQTRASRGTDKRSAETREKIRQKRLQNPQSEKSKILNRQKHLGKKHSDETKLKISMLKKNMSVETRMKMSQSRIGRKVSNETRQKQREKSLGHLVSEKTKEVLRHAQLGMKLWNNGEIQIRSKSSPGSAWKLGKIKTESSRRV
jgi:hypothetical protein